MDVICGGSGVKEIRPLKWCVDEWGEKKGNLAEQCGEGKAIWIPQTVKEGSLMPRGSCEWRDFSWRGSCERL